MSGARTEQPTPRRLREAARRGQVARSVELSAAGAFAGGLAALAVFGPKMASALAGALCDALRSAATSGADPAASLSEAARLVVRAALPVGLSALAGSLLATALQGGAGLYPKLLRPRLERVDPGKGLRRLFAPARLGRTALAVAKAGALVIVLAAWWRGAARPLGALPRASAPAAASAALAILAPLAVELAGALALAGVLDLALERRRVRRSLMMTRDEVRRELREDEGDPERKAERRRVHRALVEAGSVARATVVVVNPTRIAVALRYARGEDDAPRIVAKGTGLAADRIRSSARRAGVPIVRDVPLARALHRLADVGDEIPEELYEAAAALLSHLHAPTETP